MRTFGAQTSMRGFTNCEYFWLSQNQNGWVRILIEGACAPPCQLVYSTEMSLPVGFCLTIYFAQSVSSKLLRESLQPLCSQPLTDRSCLKVLQQSKTPTLITWAVWGCNRIGVEEAVMRAKSHFESIGLKLHKLDVRNAAATTLGINLDLTNFATENTPKRLGQCYHSISHALPASAHAPWACVSRSFVNFSWCYAFIVKCHENPTPIWQSVKEELAALRGVDDFYGRLVGSPVESDGLCVRFPLAMGILCKAQFGSCPMCVRRF